MYRYFCINFVLTVTLVSFIIYSCIGGGDYLKADRRKLELAMARAKMNKSDLCRKASMPIPTVGKVIAGRSVLPGTLGRVAEALGVDVTEILGE